MSQLIVWRCGLCRGVASALTVNAIESAIQQSAAKNIVSFFNTGTPSIKSGPAVRTVFSAFPFHVMDEPVAAGVCRC
ncbi:MAG TPA: hypothetical protein VL198_19685 [Pseudolabrys sp.]|jgi:hypothetical protein|nr:hypothetical protein [Pseudolabrys sp.]